MSELNLQTKIYKNLKKTWKKINIFWENAYISGVTDILIKDKKNVYSFEIKIKPNNALIKQLNKQRFTSHYLIAVTFKPEKEKTQKKWKKIAVENNINLIYWNINKKFLIKRKELVKNPNFDSRFLKVINYV